MAFSFGPEYEEFRQEIRQFMQTHVPPDLARRTFVGAHPPLISDWRRWQRILAAHGWGAPHWPVEYGGTGWDAVRKHIFMEELYNADGLDYGMQGAHMIAPVLIAFGSQAQKDRFLPAILSGEEYWCQGFSEPGAGSDLASLRTRAELSGDEWVIQGQKIWTSDAQFADWGFFLVRTEPDEKPQRGISMLLIKMDTPGITVRPITGINGGHELNEVFLDNVRIPADQIVGERGQGWTYAKYLLSKERTASAMLYANKRDLDKAKAIARRERRGNTPLAEIPEFARKIAEVEVELLALEWSVLRILADAPNLHNADAVVSALKNRGSEMQQRVTGLQMEMLGTKALRDFESENNGGAELPDTECWPDYVPGRASAFIYQRAATVYGGSREVQKNIIAKLAFGL